MTGHLVGRRGFLFGGAAVVATPMLLRGGAASARPGGFGFPALDLRGVYVRDIVFPVEGSVRWSDTYGACRDGCSRRHEGQDLLGRKLQRLVAAVDGTVVVVRHGRDGNSLYLRSSADGWYYAYLHINNDAPGTDDGRNAYGHAFAPGIVEGVRVRRGQHLAYMGDSGNAEDTPAHCHFEIRKPAPSVWDAQAVNPKYSLDAAGSAPVGPPSAGVRAPAGVPSIRRGHSGSKVGALQLAMNYGTGSRLVGDGQFGPATEKAVRNLQRWVRLAEDGIYGPKSQWVLQVACNG
ncbi:MAG: peptidoglycan DD-metalloendopeptidase family protein [Acidimicrobiales bacterium]